MRRRILAALVALALAAVGCLAVLAYVRAADTRALAGREAAWVLVTTRRVPAGTTTAAIREQGYVERVAMPASTVPKDALGSLDSAFDALAVTGDVQAGQLLLRGMFGEPTRLSGGLALPEGKLAVSVEMTAAARVAGYVRPGSKVAVFDTFAMQEGKGRVPAGGGQARAGANQATRVLLPRLEVIAVGERGTAGAATSVPAATQAPGADGTARPSTAMLITVAVSQDEAERLVHASQTGTLYLALLDDTAKIEPGQGVDNNTLFP
ncbi:Flp pilus assembly protein CpaB [Micromonospora sp. NPDC049679]|uniref:Flp pilus assembly protein CpaB n=1 Tax=Micromonospora sp. NPDC049679 TaxID=3155920 RepID=UPI0033D21091